MGVEDNEVPLIEKLMTQGAWERLKLYNLNHFAVHGAVHFFMFLPVAADL